MRRAAMFLLLSAILARPAFSQDPAEVRKIGFAGAKSFDEELLRAAIISDQTRCNLFLLCWFGTGIDRSYVDEIGLRGDLVRLRMFYYQRGFREAKVRLDTLASGDRLEISFAIDEGRPVRVSAIEVTGGGVIGGGLPLAVGQPFSLLAYEAARDTLTARLANQGYARAEVLANYTIPRDSQYSARVGFEVIAGERLRFGEITINGAESVSPAVVRRMLTFGSGDYYSYHDVLRSQRNLFGLETFRHVEIRADVNATADTLVPVVAQVNEGNLHRVRFGVGMSTAEFISTEGVWTSRNFLGGARRLEARARLYNVLSDVLHYVPGFENTRDPYNDLSGLVSVDFSQPWFFDALNSFNAGAYAERRSLPDIFVRNARGGYFNFTRSLGAGESFAIGYRPELTELSAGGDPVFCVNFVACGSDEIRVLRDPHWLSPLAFAYARDRSNSLFAPTGGYIVRFDGEYAAQAVGSDFTYSRLIAEITDYSQLARGVVLAARVRPGWARALGGPGQGLGLHPQKRFFGGGPNSVRGFAQFRMGPKLLTVDATEFLIEHCSAEQINSGSCDVALLADTLPGRFEVRPVGGAAILEG
ncbi:MAG: BamA/OMP85 family outer membrane protein, partial [Gemmatimonadota bacterium]